MVMNKISKGSCVSRGGGGGLEKIEIPIYSFQEMSWWT